MRLSWKQVVASVGGAVLAAVALSFLGAKGTILGVALGSAAATIGSALVFHSIDEGHAKVKEIISRPSPAPGSSPPPTQLPVGSEAALPARPLPPPLRGSRRPAGRRWSIFAAIALVFAISLGCVTAIELAIGRPLSTAVGQSSSGAKTSLGGLFGATTTTSSTTTTTTSSTSSTTSSTSSTTSSTTTTSSPGSSSTTSSSTTAP